MNFECDSQLLLLFTVRMAVQCISDTVFIFVREQRTQIGLKIGSQQFTSAAVNGHIYCVYCYFSVDRFFSPLCYSFSALTLLVWRQEKHLACKKSCTSNLQRFFGQPVENVA